MTPEAQNTIIAFVLGGFAVIGVYLLIVVPALVVWHNLTSITTPLPDKKIDNVFRKWGA